MRFFHTLCGSFYSAPLYATARRDANFGLGYSLLVVLATSLLTVIVGLAVLHRVVLMEHDGKPPLFDDLVHQITAQTPVMILKDNRLQTRDARAHVIHLRAQFLQYSAEGDVITIDTTGASTHSNMKTPVLVTATEVAIKGSKETKIKPLSDYTHNAASTLVINRALADDIGNRIIAAVHGHVVQFYLIAGSINWFVYAFVMYVLRVFMLLALGVVGLALGPLFRVKMTYASAVTLAAISYTPVALAELAVLLTSAHSVNTLVLLLGGMVMLGAAIYTMRDEPLAAAQ